MTPLEVLDRELGRLDDQICELTSFAEKDVIMAQRATLQQALIDILKAGNVQQIWVSDGVSNV